MTSWPRDNEAALIAFYGEPGPAVERQLVHVVPPFQMFYDDGKKLIPLKSLLFHKKAADALMVALNRVWEKCGKDQSLIDKLRISRTAGTYCHRKISGSSRWSNHAFGGAIDIDSARNGFNTGKGTQPTLLTDAFDSVGFRWGGRYKGRTDPMHYEACDDGSPHPVALLDIPESAGVDFDPWNGEDHVMGCALVDTGEGEHEDESAARGSGDDDGDTRRASAGGFFGRFRNWATGLFSGTAFAGIGALSDWKIAALLVCAVVGIALLGFLMALWLFGKQNVADWVARHVA